MFIKIKNQENTALALSYLERLGLLEAIYPSPIEVLACEEINASVEKIIIDNGNEFDVDRFRHLISVAQPGWMSEFNSDVALEDLRDEVSYFLEEILERMDEKLVG